MLATMGLLRESDEHKAARLARRAAGRQKFDDARAEARAKADERKAARTPAVAEAVAEPDDPHSAAWAEWAKSAERSAKANGRLSYLEMFTGD